MYEACCFDYLAVMSCSSAHDKRCTITVLYSIVGDDCLQDSDRVSGRNWQVGCSTERSKQSLRVDVGVLIGSVQSF